MMLATTQTKTLNCNALQARVRGYLAKAETQLKEGKYNEKQELLVQQMVGFNCRQLIPSFDIHQVKEFKTRLKAAKYHGSYFDRSSEKKTRICDDTGKKTAIKWQS